MHVNLSDATAVALAACYAVLVGIVMPLALAHEFSKTGRSSFVVTAVTLTGAAAAIGLIGMDLLANRYFIFMSDVANRLLGGVSNAVIAASTWIAPTPKRREHFRKPVCIVLLCLTLVALLATLPQAWKLGGL